MYNESNAHLCYQLFFINLKSSPQMFLMEYKVSFIKLQGIREEELYEPALLTLCNVIRNLFID